MKAGVSVRSSIQEIENNLKMRSMLIIVSIISTLVNYSHGYIGGYDIQELLRSNVKFTNTLYTALVKQRKSDNIFFSPTMLHEKLAFLHLNSGGKTAQQLADAMHLPNSKDLILSTFNTFNHLFWEVHHEHYSMINNMYIDNTFSLQKEFIKNISGGIFLSMKFKTVEFRSAGLAQLIVNDISANDFEDVSTSLVEKLHSKDTNMALVAATYFMGRLRHPFVVDKKVKITFYVRKNHTEDVNSMTCAGEFKTKYDDHIGANIVEMPFRGAALNLILIVPFQMDGLFKVEKKLTAKRLSKILESSGIVKNYLRVTVPKFNMRYNTNLKPALQSVGVTDMFNGSVANFTRISNETGFHMDEIIHMAEVAIDFENTAVIAAVDNKEAAENDPGYIVADRPFLYIIQCRATGGIAFMGRYVKPPTVNATAI